MDSKIYLLPAPDSARYVFYHKKPQRVLNFRADYNVKVPQGLSAETEKAMAEALMKKSFLYFEEQVRKFMDDLNSVGMF